MKKVRLGVLGVGPRAQGLVECYSINPDLEFVAFADIAKDRAATVAAEFNQKHGTDVKAYTSYEDMIKGTPMDALFIAIDPDKQVDYAVDAMNKGIHVMTEVPAAFTIEQCWKLVEAVEKNGVKYQLAEQMRYSNFVRQWNRMAKAGDLGKIYYAEGEYLHYEKYWDNLREKETNYAYCPKTLEELEDPKYVKSWRFYCFQNPIFYLPHDLSPLLLVTGGRIEKVSCVGTKLGSYTEPHFPSRDLQTALMYNSNDSIFSLRAGFTAPNAMKNDTFGHWYQLKGTKTNVETARSTIDTMKMYKAGGEWESADWGTAIPDDPENIRNANHGGLDYYPIHHFVNAILNDAPLGMDVYQAVETAAPAIMAAESCAKGGILLNVPDFRVPRNK